MVELLSPSGDFESFLQALYNGADAIYLAGERFGARAYAKNFSFEELCLALSYAHSKGKRIFVTVNTIIKENEYNDAINYLNDLYNFQNYHLIDSKLHLYDLAKPHLVVINTYSFPLSQDVIWSLF